MDPELAAQLLDWVRSRYFGKYRGTVVDNADAAKRGRLKVTVPAVLDTLEVWAVPCVPYAGDQVGLFAMPPAGAGVWVEFEGGDPSYPIWVGCFWGDNQAPQGGDPAIKTWKTDAITLTLDDDGDEARLENSSNASVTMTSEVVTVAGQGKHTVAGSAVTSEAGGKGKLEVQTASVRVNSGAFEVT
ncbi:MAG: phage baseplate assembly protein V [Deltaproteobacteria bacterium]|nr:phage baseplate assembly protein V [Deltaproteobacteria bacterium]